ncbi:mycofactocin biosynthesis glycosyltransferase MftF [Nocardioides sp.]|uniref:mycofactocin biosynthesis glycosyltransferase MftF n=1 Tax=Nocardioides sp. TaxID=35761 RepID=UPI002625E92A|nr:mycofactocin biosynthesis glycosyltransferase MftF [Nocardioides sp.]
MSTTAGPAAAATPAPAGSAQQPPSEDPRYQPLPDGFRLRLRADTATHRTPDGAIVLIGGSPTRSIRLSPAAVRLLAGPTLTVTDAAAALVARRLLDGNLADPEVTAPLPVADLTVVVPVRDRPAQLDRCLAALRSTSSPAPAPSDADSTPTALPRLLVVDDASHDPAAVAAVAARHGAEVIALSTNVGPAGARNAGLTAVTTTAVAFVDSDVTAPLPALVALTAQLADPRVALVGPLVRGVLRSPRPRWFERYDAGASSLALGERRCSVAVGAAVGWLPSACLVARTAALRSLDRTGFDDAMRVGEDVDLVWRTLAAGWTVRYEPGVEVGHDVRAGLGEMLSRKLLYGTGSGPLADRHGDAVAVARLTPLMAAAGAGILLRRPWSVTLAAAATWSARRSVAATLPEFDGRGRTADLLALRGLGWSVRQESALLLRHWWPAAAVGCAVSPTVRRMVGSAVLVDTAVALTLDRPLRRPDLPGVGLPTLLVGRRLDDLAYGLGVWVGAVRSRSWRGLAVDVVRRRSGRRTTAG